MKPRNRYEEYRFVAYDATNGEYEEFKTLKEAEDWLTECDAEGISEEAINGNNYIAEIQYRSVVKKIDEKSNYHENEDGELVNDDGEEWPISDQFDWLANHTYERMEYED